MSWTFPGNVREISRTFPVNVREISRNFPGNFPDVSRKISWKFPGFFPGNFPSRSFIPRRGFFFKTRIACKSTYKCSERIFERSQQKYDADTKIYLAYSTFSNSVFFTENMVKIQIFHYPPFSSVFFKIWMLRYRSIPFKMEQWVSKGNRKILVRSKGPLVSRTDPTPLRKSENRRKGGGTCSDIPDRPKSRDWGGGRIFLRIFRSRDFLDDP